MAWVSMPVSFPQKHNGLKMNMRYSCSRGQGQKNHLCPEIQECLGQQDRVEVVKFLKAVVLRTKIWFSTCVIIFQDKPVWCEFLAAKWRCGHEEAEIKPQTHIVPRLPPRHQKSYCMNFTAHFTSTVTIW